MSVADAREAMLAMAALSGEAEPVGKVEDRDIPGPEGKILLRIYTPAGKGPFPILVFFHGGGWVIGNIESYDVICRKLSRLLQHPSAVLKFVFTSMVWMNVGSKLFKRHQKRNNRLKDH